MKVLSTGLLFLVLTSFSSDSLPKNFASLLERAGMTFEKPEGFKAVKVIENKQMNYDYAIKYTKKNLKYVLRLYLLTKNFRITKTGKK